MDNTQITAIVGGIIAILTILIPGIVTIINALKQNTAITVAGQKASQTRGVVRDSKIQEIHLLVNSRLQTVLKLLVVSTKREADRTHSIEDIAAYQNALKELELSEVAATELSKAFAEESSAQEIEALKAEQNVVELTKSVAIN